jgi:streptogramin lyase
MLSATAAASDDVGVTTVVFTLSGAVTATDTRVVNTLSTSQTFSYRLPFVLAAGLAVTLQVDASDTYGHKTSAAPVGYTTLADTAGPTIAPVAASPVKTGDLYTSGDVVTFTVTATDNVGVQTIRLTIDGQTTTYSASPAVLVWTAPVVGGNTPYSLDVEVLDYAGNRSTASKALSVVPAGGGTFPAVSFSCPTAGAYLPSAYAGLLLTATATDSGGISKIEFFRPGDVTPFSTSTPSVGTPSPYTGSSTAVTLPTAVSDTVVRYRARAWNPSSHFTETFVDVHVVPTVDAASATSTDFAVLRSGTLTIDTTRTFAGLIVLRGATITHSAFTGTQSVNLTVNGPLYVECGGSIDASGKGYGASKSYPGETTPGGDTGGSHIGYGGFNVSPLGTTYGSISRPSEAGGGAGGDDPGGGVIRIVAGSVGVDGAVRANGGAAGGRASGGGGSVWVTTGPIGGGGTIEARGGDTVGFGTGGGGAIAVEYTSTGGSVLSNLNARTGSPSTRNQYGGAGTVYLKGPSAVYGDLAVDNLGVAISQATEIPSLGGGTAQTGTSGAALVTDRTVDVPTYFAGHWVEIYDSTGVTLKGTWRIGAIAAKTVTLVPNGAETISVVVGDKWQGVYRFDNVTMKGVRVLSTDPVRATATQIQGVVEVKRVDSGSLTVKPGATLTHLAPAVGSSESLMVDLAGALTVESGGAIDVSGRGYAASRSYAGATTPGGDTGGSHLGYGGFNVSPLGSTFGSVSRPSEAGGGAGGDDPGGGVIRVVAGSVSVDGAVRANGGAAGGRASGGGGSVWVTTGAIGGGGTIEARGGDTVGFGTGGGGAIAIEYTSSSGAVLSGLVARTGSPSTRSQYGGAGTAYLKGPSATFGNLAVDNGGKNGQTTELPSLGSGVAQAGTSGATLVTDRATNIPAHFAGHWVEIYDFTGTTLKGTWRVSTATGGIVNKTVILVPNGAETISIAVGDKWQGVYRFDQVSVVNGANLASVDPVRVFSSAVLDGGVVDTLAVAGPVEVRNFVTARRIDAQSLTVKSGGTLRQWVTTGTAESLTVNLMGALAVESGGAIDVSGRGYGASKSYPGATTPGGDTGGSHLGYGGFNVSPLGSTYGSVSRPSEAGGGAGGDDPGGGVIRIVAGSVSVDGAVRANGGAAGGRASGGGGSVWVTTGAFGGGGSIEARGGDAVGFGTGGGGAIAVEYTSTSGSVLSNLIARTGSPSTRSQFGGAGTVLLKGPSSTYGDLTVINKGISGQPTALPSLGNGTAQAGTSGATLVTDRASNIPAYFAGHWVEIYDSTGVTLKGTWRISTAAAGIVNKTVTLVPNGAETISIAVGDKWQGVYHFDGVSVGGNAILQSLDPIVAPGFDRPTGTLEFASGQASSVLAGSIVNLALTASDSTGLASVTLRASGPVTGGSVNQTKSTGNVTTYSTTFQVTLLQTAAVGNTVTIAADIYDKVGTLTTTASLVVTVLADTTPPNLSNPRPPDGAIFNPGQQVTIGVDASDNVGVASVDITVNGSTTTKTAAPYELVYTPGTVPVATTVPIRFVARDFAGNPSTLNRTITIIGQPSMLAFGTQPSNTTAGSTITPAVTVKLLDDAGNQTTSTTSVTVAIGTNPAGGTLSGTLTVAAVGGMATFSDLSIDKLGAGYTLTAASAGLTGAASGTFNVTAAAATKILVETAADGSGTVVPAQNVTAGSSLIVYAISRDASNSFVANVVPDSWSLNGITGGVAAGDLVANTLGSFAEFSIPTTNSEPYQIAAGPDGNLWFGEYSGGANKIGRITPGGVITEFPIPSGISHPLGIAAGPDGNVWFAEYGAHKIGRITPAGVITEFQIAAGIIGPYGIAAGPDGNLWFTENSGFANKIGRITPAGVVTEFSIPTANSGPSGIAAGPDGNLWFTESSANKIGRITTAGVIAEFPIPTAGSGPSGIAAGPDSNLWFTEYQAGKIGRITPAGVITEFSIPTFLSNPMGIVAGPDGNLWFAERYTNKIGRITTAGVFTEFPIPTSGGYPEGIASGPDGNLWFTESLSNKIGRIATGRSATFMGHLVGSAAIHVAKTGLTSTDSGTLTVLPGAASRLVFGTQPSSTTAGSPITPAVTMRILDAGGNLIASTAPVTVAIGTNPGGGTLFGTLTVAAVAGVATFSDLSIDRAGTGYTLTASSAGLTGASSSSFNVTVGPASKLVFGTQPFNRPVGSVITPAVTVKILDVAGNQTASTASVTVAIGTNPGGGTLSGNLTVAAVAGVATFSNLSIDKFGTGYTLTASSTGLTGTTSGTFNVTAGAAAKILVETAANGSGTVVPAQNVAAGSSLTVYAISRDASNNFVANVVPDSWSLVGVTGGVVAGDLVANAAGSFSEISIPTAGTYPEGLAAGSDGNLWFTEYSGNKIARITTSGVVTEFSIPTVGSQPRGIAAGPDGNLWFTEYGANKIGRITTAGVVTEFTIPTVGSQPRGIAAGPDGNLWFTEYGANKIGRITTAGVVTEFTIPTAGCQTLGIAAGPDGNMWFTEINVNKIGRITTAGVVTEFTIPTASSYPWGIASGPDGNLWFTELNTNKIGRITTSGVVTEFSAGNDPRGIAVGPDGNLWFTEHYGNKIGRITTAGVVTEFAIPTAGSQPLGIAGGADGNLWFVENAVNKIGRIATGGSATFTGHLAGSAAIHAAKAGLTSTDSGVLTVVGASSVSSRTPALSLSIRALSLCAVEGQSIKPGGWFTLCADTGGLVEGPGPIFDVEIRGAFEARHAAYENCVERIAVPTAASPGMASIVVTARDRSGNVASATTSLEVVPDLQTPTIVAVSPAGEMTLAPNEGTVIGVEAWDDVGVASVAITVDGQRTVLNEPPYRLAFWALPVSSATTLSVEIEVADPSGNVARHSGSIRVVPAGAAAPTQPSALRAGDEPGIVFDGGWPYRDAPDRVSETVLPTIGFGAVTAVDGDGFSAAGVTWTKEAAGAFVEIRRGGTAVGRFRIEAVTDEGRALVLEAAARGLLSPGDTFTGIWSFPSLTLRRGAHLVTSDVLEVKALTIDSSSSLVARNLVVPASGAALPACSGRGPIEPPAGLSPRGSEGWR